MFKLFKQWGISWLEDLTKENNIKILPITYYIELREEYFMKKNLLFSIILSLLLLTTACSLSQSSANEQSDSKNKEISIIVFDDPVFKQIADIAVDEVAKQGYTLKPIFMNDIVQPNEIVDKKEAYANYFQHIAYLNQFNKDHGTKVVPAFHTFIDPAGIYSKRYKSLEEIPKGGTIAIPLDPANNGRALFMLQKEGLLKLKAGVDVVHASPKDIIENPLNLKFKEVDQQMLGRTIEDVDAGFMFTAIAISSGLSPKDALVLEDENDDIKPYSLVVGVHPDDKDSEKTEVLRKAFQNDRVKKVLEENYPLVITAW